MNSNKRDLMTDIMQRVSPALALFAYRVLQDSYRLGIKQLFFIAREGIFLKAVFSHMAKQFPELQKLFPHNKQFKVLYTSRSASIVGRYAKPDNIADVLQPLTLTAHKLTLKNLLRTWNVSIQDFSHATQELLLRHINESKYDALSQLIYDTDFGKEFDRILTQKQDCFYQYLSQQGALDHDKIALIDVGWHGTIQYNIATLLKQKQQAQKIYGFYFGTRQDNGAAKKLGLNSIKLPGYIFSETTGLDMHVFMHAVPILETMLGCEATSTVRGYKKIVNHIIEPIFEKPEAPQYTHTFQKFTQHAILEGCGFYAKKIKTPSFSSAVETRVCRKKLINFFTNPKRRYIKHFDNLNFDYGWRQEHASTIVYKPRLKEWLRPFKLIKKLMTATWPHASLKRFFLLCEIYNWYRRNYYLHSSLSIVINKLKNWGRACR